MTRPTTFLLAMAVAAGVRADTIRMQNGDVLNGELAGVSATHVTLESETLGTVRLPREKVRSIHFGDAPLEEPVAPRVRSASTAEPAPAATADAPLQALLGRRVDPAGPEGDTPEDVLNRMRAGGVDRGEMNQVLQQFPLLQTPEAGGYFNEMLGGLLDGSRDLQDLRRDAVRARDELRDLKEELGAPGAALNGYLSILNRFIDQVPAPRESTAPGNPNGPRR